MIHTKRRWHGHPVFPILVALGGQIEVRASWEGYLKEFRVAYQGAFISLHKSGRLKRGNFPSIGEIEPLNNLCEVGDLKNAPLSSFEAKYHRVGLPVHRLIIKNETFL